MGLPHPIQPPAAYSALDVIRAFRQITQMLRDTSSQRHTCMFTVALFIIARRWKQPKYPSTDEKINKMGYIQTMECYSAVKRNEGLTYAMSWMNLEDIILRERSQSQRTMYDHYDSVDTKCPEQGNL